VKAIAIMLTIAAVGTLLVREYIQNGTRRWFTSSLPNPESISQWTNDELDQRLYKLSRWDDFSPAQFQRFVEHQIKGLRLNEKDKFHFLEVGVGVGAFTRHILHKFPKSSGMGIDLESEVVAIAATILPSARMELHVSDMLKIPVDANEFDYVFVPGSLCYLHSLDDVKAALTEFSRVLKPGGGLCASMLASATSDMGSCNIRISKSMWMLEGLHDYGMVMVSMEEMNDWGLPHALGRYSTCMRKGLY